MRQTIFFLVTALVLSGADSAAWSNELALGEPEDLALLAEHEIATDVEGLRLFLQPPGPSEEDVRLARLWAAQLGSEKFAEREAASEKLLAMGLDALEAVEQAAESQDAETRTRARGILARLHKLKEKHDAVLPAVLRTIVRQQTKGLAPQVLKAAPYAAGDAAQECLRRALWATVTADDADMLRQTIAVGAPAARVAAALALPAALGEAARDELLSLLTHEDAATRFAAAQAVAPLTRCESLRTLIDGLRSQELSVRMQAARVLRALTGEHFGYAAYAASQRRAAAVERWEAWLTKSPEQAPLRQPLTEGPLPRGRFLLCHYDPYSVTELDETNRVWFQRRSEIPEDEAYGGCTVSPEGYRVLAGFGSVVAFQGQGAGAVAWRFTTPDMQAAIDRTPKGTYLLGLQDDALLREVKSNGEVVREVKLRGEPSDVRYASPDRVLLALYTTRQLVEIDPQGEIVWRIENVPPPESARRLANGNTLTTTALGKVHEYAPDGELVWSYSQSIPLAYDAVELPTGNVLIGYRRGLREVDRKGDTVHEWPTATVRRICVY